MKKYQIAVINGPYVLLQTLWYFSRNKTDHLAAVIVRFGDQKLMQEMKEACERSGIFEKVILAKADYLNQNLKEKMGLFLKMFFFWSTGRKRQYCLKIIQNNIGDLGIDSALISYDYSVFSGALMQYLPENKVTMLEDGFGDYHRRVRFPKLKLYSLLGWMTSKMGYMNINVADGSLLFPIKSSRKCIKYANMPHELQYREYKDIRQLFENDELTEARFQELISKVFLQNEEICPDQTDIILFTAPLWDYDKDEEYYKKTYEWLKKNHSDKRILIKKHPRDKMPYDWTDLNVKVGYGNIPGEIFAAYSKKLKIYLMFPSTMLMSLKSANCKFKVFKYTYLTNLKYFENVEMVSDLIHIKENEMIDIR